MVCLLDSIFGCGGRKSTTKELNWGVRDAFRRNLSKLAPNLAMTSFDAFIPSQFWPGCTSKPFFRGPLVSRVLSKDVPCVARMHLKAVLTGSLGEPRAQKDVPAGPPDVGPAAGEARDVEPAVLARERSELCVSLLLQALALNSAERDVITHEKFEQVLISGHRSIQILSLTCFSTAIFGIYSADGSLPACGSS